MLDNLRAMGVFACVIKQGSFNGAAKKLGITTSAVSQQVRALEMHMNATLLHRSTRKISLTEVGQVFYHSCEEMLEAAERGKLRIGELQDNLLGEIRIATTPILGVLHVVPALSRWIQAHPELSFSIKADYSNYIDPINDDVDISIRLENFGVDFEKFEAYPLATVKQMLVASPSYINQREAIKHPQDLDKHALLSVKILQDSDSNFVFCNKKSNEKITICMRSNIHTNNVFIMKTLSLHGHGVCRILSLNVQQELQNGTLVQLLPDWTLPDFTFYVVVLKEEQQSFKIKRCLEVLKNYFSQLPHGLLG